MGQGSFFFWAERARAETRRSVRGKRCGSVDTQQAMALGCGIETNYLIHPEDNFFRTGFLEGGHSISQPQLDDDDAQRLPRHRTSIDGAARGAE